ncbi:hypothetical protein [Rathayibacter toxicus]|uniref:Uncharacterized protein n=3 Tax=Rathayibacter toxicus TaxID=145458 RepID=A0A0C5BFC2_9MICO|nr:hypothetical protein [Rathayibacter toxicus]AJM76960.1 hypothetical protein TI83_01205 [Rathayibacter toxicus]AJM77779.1 hypothetical protein TI83_07110 [Rathayibacter toxicus]KKM46537.1 hypothetical protein VT73_02475 [Rathayibacter toxicus]
MLSQPDLNSESLRYNINRLPVGEKSVVCDYLDRGVALFEWMEPSIDLLEARFEIPAGRGMKTDGRFYWRADAAAYVNYHDVDISDKLLTWIKSSPQRKIAFAPSQISEMQNFLQCIVYGGCSYPSMTQNNISTTDLDQLIESSHIVYSIGILSRPDIYESSLYPFIGQIHSSEREAIAEYLDRGVMLVGWMGSSEKIFGTLQSHAGGMLTDGQYYWRMDAGDYVRMLGAGIPSPVLRSMKRREGKPITISHDSGLRKFAFFRDVTLGPKD